MPIYPDIPIVHYYPGPERFVRALVAELTPPPTSILDVGTGHGGVFDTGFWTENPTVTRRVACDIGWIRPLPPQWQPVCGVDVCDLSARFGEASFDYVQCMEMMEHVPIDRQRRALENLVAVTRQLVVITSADEGQHRGPEQAAIELRNPHQRYVRQPAVDDLRSLGFEVRVEHYDRRQLVAWMFI